MKFFLNCYANKNLGDDLFLYMLCKKFRKIDFVTYSNDSYRICKNLKIKKISFLNKVLNKLLLFLSNGKYNIEWLLLRKYDLYVLIGGSMFIETKYTNKYANVFIPQIPYFVIGSNFGPFKHQRYFDKYKTFFENANSVSFRDDHSYNLFDNLENTFVYPDLVFALEMDKELKQETTDRRKVIFSLIDVSSKNLTDFKEDYKKLIINLVKKFDLEGFEIIFMSFCRDEGDERAINDIAKDVPSCIKYRKYFYDGDVVEAVNLIYNADFIVGSRFHANILGLKYSKKILPIAYSDKIVNVLKDLEYSGPLIKIENLKDFDVDNFNVSNLDFQIDIKRIQQRAEQHFIGVESFIQNEKNY